MQYLHEGQLSSMDGLGKTLTLAITPISMANSSDTEEIIRTEKWKVGDDLDDNDHVDLELSLGTKSRRQSGEIQEELRIILMIVSKKWVIIYPSALPSM